MKKFNARIFLVGISAPALLFVMILGGRMLHKGLYTASTSVSRGILAGINLETVVEQFFPQSLIDDSVAREARGGPGPSKFFDFAEADLNGVGASEFIVAAYSNGFSGAVRALKRQNSSFILVDEPNLPFMLGIFPRVGLQDLDRDGKPEVIVSFSSARGREADWVFRWTGTRLVVISPIVTDEDGNVSTILADAGFIDINGDGLLEIVNSPQIGPFGVEEEEISPGVFEIYSLVNGNFAFSKETLFFATFVRSTREPVEESRPFVSRNPIAPFVLRVVNGEAGGKNRVSSAVIKLNGVVVVGPERFNQQVAEITVPVTLQRENALSAEIRSAPGGRITTTIEPQSQ